MLVGSKKGVTLPEVMVAFLILVVAIFGALGAIDYGAKATRSDFRQGESVQILADRMSKISSLPYKELVKFVQSTGGSPARINNSILNGDIVFGEVTVGNNKYNTYAIVEYLPMTFKGLMQLNFPNKEYDPEKPYTWDMVRRGDTGEEKFDGKAGNKKFGALKVSVYVKPIKYNMVKGRVTRNEREVVAVTYITDLES